jgi:hypothetical protein
VTECVVTDDENQQEDEILTKSPDGGKDVEEKPTSGSRSRIFDIASQRLVLDMRGVDVGHISQWYFVS